MWPEKNIINFDINLPIFNCVCGSKIKNTEELVHRHLRRKKHIDYMDKNKKEVDKILLQFITKFGFSYIINKYYELRPYYKYYLESPVYEDIIQNFCYSMKLQMIHHIYSNYSLYVILNTFNYESFKLNKKMSKFYNKLNIKHYLKNEHLSSIYYIFNNIQKFTLSNNINECPICYEDKKTIYFTCKHYTCNDCFNNIKQKGLTQCHMCRDNIKYRLFSSGNIVVIDWEETIPHIIKILKIKDYLIDYLINGIKVQQFIEEFYYDYIDNPNNTYKIFNNNDDYKKYVNDLTTNYYNIIDKIVESPENEYYDNNGNYYDDLDIHIFNEIIDIHQKKIEEFSTYYS